MEEDEITTYLDPIKLFWDLVQQNGWNSTKVYQAQQGLQTNVVRVVLGHVEHLMRKGKSPISNVSRSSRTCAECHSRIDDNLYEKLFQDRKLVLCYKCWRFLYPVD